MTIDVFSEWDRFSGFMVWNEIWVHLAVINPMAAKPYPAKGASRPRRNRNRSRLAMRIFAELQPTPVLPDAGPFYLTATQLYNPPRENCVFGYCITPDAFAGILIPQDDKFVLLFTFKIPKSSLNMYPCEFI